MESVIRALVVYGFLLLMVRIAGRRTLGELTAFDFVLLLIIGDVTELAILGDDHSITNAMVVIATLMGADIVLGQLKARSNRLEKWVDGAPLILVQDGVPFKERLRKSRLDEEDVMASARSRLGLENMSQVKWAVLEADGQISIIPQRAGVEPDHCSI